jgi:hypothetical protein
MMLLALMTWLPWLLLGAGGLFLGFRAVRAFERRGAASSELTALRERLQFLEDTVAEHGVELQRVADGQAFTQRLLSERTGSAGNATHSER